MFLGLLAIPAVCVLTVFSLFVFASALVSFIACFCFGFACCLSACPWVGVAFVCPLS